MKSLIKVLLTICLVGCSNNKIVYGGLGGAAVGAGVGAMAGKASSSISVAHGTAVGAGVGIPVGIGVAYTAAAVHNYSNLASNDLAIDANATAIADNERLLQEERTRILLLEDHSTPDEDSFGYIYLGPSLGNAWR